MRSTITLKELQSPVAEAGVKVNNWPVARRKLERYHCSQKQIMSGETQISCGTRICGKTRQKLSFICAGSTHTIPAVKCGGVKTEMDKNTEEYLLLLRSAETLEPWSTNTRSDQCRSRPNY